MNAYKTTKAIRFKLEPIISETIQKDVEELKRKNEDFNLVNFVSSLGNFISGTKRLLFKNTEQNAVLKKNLNVKTEWLRTFAKKGLAAYKESQSQNLRGCGGNRRTPITIGDISDLPDRIMEFFNECDGIYKELCNDAVLQDHERARRERYGLLLKRLQSKLPFIVSLVENISDKNEMDDLSVILKNQVPNLHASLLAGIATYLPAQSNGCPVAKASFNYYTLNKKPVDFDEKRRKLKEYLTINAVDQKAFDNWVGKNRMDNAIRDIREPLFADIKAADRKSTRLNSSH